MDVEQLIRETLAEHSRNAPDPAVLLQRKRGRTGSSRPIGLWVSAAVVVVVTLAIAGITQKWTHTSHGTPAATSAVAPTTSRSVAPPDTKLVDFHGISIRVPNWMKVEPALCQPTEQNLVTYQTTAHPNCPAMEDPPTKVDFTRIALSSRMSSVEWFLRYFSATTASADGKPALEGFRSFGAETEGVLYIPSLIVIVDVIAPTKDLVESVLQTAKILP